MSINKGMMSCKTVECETPQHVFDVLDKEFHFALDVCASLENAKCRDYYTKSCDGLTHSWLVPEGKSVWMNPPYGRAVVAWMRRAATEVRVNALVCLVAARTDTAWWHEYAMKADEIRFVRGRLRFGCGRGPAPFPSAVLVFYPSFENPYKLNVPIIRSVSY